MVPVWLQALAKYLRFRVKRGKDSTEKISDLVGMRDRTWYDPEKISKKKVR